MKKYGSILLSILLLLSLCACGQDIGVIGSEDGPTTVISGQPTQEEPAPQESTPALPEIPQPAEPQEPALPTVHGDMDPFNRTWGEMQGANFWLALCDDPQAIRMTSEENTKQTLSVSTHSQARVVSVIFLISSTAIHSR